MSTEPWLEEALSRKEKMSIEAKQIRATAEKDLFFFAKLVNPGYTYGSIHKECFRWLQEYTLYGKGSGQSSNKLMLLPRSHLKSHTLATACAWLIARHPEITILYVSATSDLACTQLYDIKNILTSPQFKKYWPEYVHPEANHREKWTESRITIDHPQRRKEGVRDATISTAGLTTTTTGWHADVVVFDDIVVPENAYTETGREEVSKKSSQFASIRNPGGFTWAAGTRYDGRDIYGIWKTQAYEDYDEEGESLGKKPSWEIKEYVVEIEGLFLWPRTVRMDGKAFGFDNKILARLKADYTDQTQFYAQYYNDPNDPSSDRIGRDKFQYYSPRFLKKEGGNWFFNGKRLNIYAAVDFAYSLGARADYTAIVVVGVDCDRNIYILDIDRFKADRNIEYFKHTLALHAKWRFKKLQAEVTAAQVTIVNDIKDYIRNEGLNIVVVEHRPSRHEGSKEERISAVLEHRYENQEVWHSEGGWTSVLEDELVLARPPHDDIKDALAGAVAISIPPARSSVDKIGDFLSSSFKINRFGGYS